MSFISKRCIKRESGENPKQSRCGKLFKDSLYNSKSHSIIVGEGNTNRVKSEDLPIVH